MGTPSLANHPLPEGHHGVVFQFVRVLLARPVVRMGLRFLLCTLFSYAYHQSTLKDNALQCPGGIPGLRVRLYEYDFNWRFTPGHAFVFAPSGEMQNFPVQNGQQISFSGFPRQTVYIHLVFLFCSKLPLATTLGLLAPHLCTVFYIHMTLYSLSFSRFPVTSSWSAQIIFLFT